MSIRTLIVDDSAAYRKLLSDVVSTLPQIDLAGTAPNGVLALTKLEQAPVDLVLLDVNMPEMDGMETLKRIRERFPKTSVVMVSGIAADSALTTIQALHMGAMEFIRKPDGGSIEKNIASIRAEIECVIRTIDNRNAGAVSSLKPPADLSPRTLFRPTISAGALSILVIGVSTGGPNALNALIPKLPPDFPLPVLIVQHMPPVFTEALARDLDRKSSIRVAEASDGLKVEPGKVIIARGGCHMVVRRKDNSMVIGLNDGPPENSCRPAVDVLFRSVADCYGDKRILSAIMTGMGNDGLAGVRALKRKSCYCITQTESTCVVYGMPRAVDEAGLSDESVGIDRMAQRLTEIALNRKF